PIGTRDETLQHDLKGMGHGASTEHGDGALPVFDRWAPLEPASRGMKKWTSGPMLTAYRSVPTPTVPPSSHPAARTRSSMDVRAIRIEIPRSASPVMRPSRGPGPSPAPM